MKPSSPATTGGPPSLIKARNCALLNLLATPGIGSFMAGRRGAGTGQLVLAVAGFVLICVWFVQTVIVTYYGLMFDQQRETQTYAPWGWMGAILFGVAWLWALASSISVYREVHAAQRARLEGSLESPPALKTP